MIAGSILVALLFAAWPSPFVIPLSPEADVFLIDADLDGTGDVAVLDGFELTVYPTGNRANPIALTLPPDARAMDIVPDPETGKMVVLAVCGGEVRLFRLADGNEAGQTLFEHTSYLSEGEQPYRQVLVFAREGESLFFLPETDAIELRTWSGELRERIEPERDEGAQRFEELTGFPDSTLSLGSATSLQFWIKRRVGNEPAFIRDQPTEDPGPQRHSWSFTAIDEFNDLDAPPIDWPWFALRGDIEEPPRVRCAIRLQPPETYVRLDTIRSDSAKGGIGPARKFPGMLTRLNAELPDFNGDGYTDLLLWNTKRPSVSPATLARMALEQDWPVRLTAHLFDPETNRYTAKPFASISVRAAWDLLLNQAYGSPLDHTVVRDIDADGRTDIAFTVDDRTYVRWMMHADGPSVEEIRMDEPIVEVSFQEALDSTARITIGLRTASKLYVIDP